MPQRISLLRVHIMLTGFTQKSLKRLLVNTLKSDDYDIVHCETIYFSPYLEAIRMNSDAKIVFSQSQCRAFNLGTTRK